MNTHLTNKPEVIEPVKDVAITVREDIFNLESELLKMEQPEIVVNHYFSDGMYAREMIMQKGLLITGKIHKKEHFCVISKGIVNVVSEEKTERIEAPAIYSSLPGTKRAIYAHEDSVWTTFHATNETDIEKIEEMFVTNDYQEYLISRDRNDYTNFLLEYDITEDEANKIKEHTEDHFNLNLDEYSLKISVSPIHGEGLFSTGFIAKGSRVMPARIDNKRTQAGRLTNHSANPNSMSKLLKNGDVDIVALRDINNEEITFSYREVLNLQRGI